MGTTSRFVATALFALSITLSITLASSVARAQCGNGVVDGTDVCDDGNTVAGDGCSATCTVEAGNMCRRQTSIALVDPSFEAPITSGSTTGWVLAAGTIDQIGSGCLPADDLLLAVDMNGSSRGEIYQDVVTMPGRTYTMTLRGSANCIDVSGQPCDRVCSKLLTISAADTATPTAPFATTTYDLPGGPQAPGGAYRDLAFTFTAASGSTRIRFSGSDPSFAGPLVDRAAIPESVCRRDTCGNGTREATEACDDGNQVGGDGCSADCGLVEVGWMCTTAGAACTSTCGDGVKVSAEACDDNNTTSGDGCSATCTIEPGWTCIVDPLNVVSRCSMLCGDGTINPGESCDDGNTSNGDGCSSICRAERGYTCSCTMPVISYSGDMLAGRLGGTGGGVSPPLGCTGNDVLIGLGFDWSNSRGEAVRTRAICGSVTVSATGVVTTTRTTTAMSGGTGCGGWDPSTASPDVTCPSGWAITGLRGTESVLGGSPTLFDSASIVCRQMDVQGRPFGAAMTLVISGGGGVGAGGMQSVDCPPGTIARSFQTRSGCAQDALDMVCGIPAATCSGSSICASRCGDGVVAAPGETCDDAGESATCDANCTAAVCGDGTLNATAGETCDDGNTNAGDGCSATCRVELPDAGMDAGRPDAGNDAGNDAGRDSGTDAGHDAGNDASADAGHDAGRDAGMDATPPDAGPTGAGIAGGACGCSAVGAHGDHGALALGALAMLGLEIRRRRRLQRADGRRS